MSADDGNAARMGFERQERSLVPEQNDSIFRFQLRSREMGRDIGKAWGGRIVDEPLREHRAQDAVDHVVEPRGRDTAVGQRLRERRPE